MFSLVALPLARQFAFLAFFLTVSPHLAAQAVGKPNPASQAPADGGTQTPRPEFSDYPVKHIYRGKPTPPLITGSYRSYRTRIREGANSEVKFAGHYTVPGWGCGTFCQGFVIVDSITGKIYHGSGIEGGLPPSWEEQHDDDPTHLEFHPDSRLLKITGCQGDFSCGFFDYVMVDGKGLKLVRKQLLPAEFQPPPEMLQWFLQKYIGSSVEYQHTQYFAAPIALRDDGSLQVIVSLTDGRSCDSGGCATLILEPTYNDYHIVTKITTVSPPIRVLNTKTNGWHDLAVHVRGRESSPEYEAKLSFDGKSYPSNPALPPAPRDDVEVAGKVVVPNSATTAPLFPQ